jgi:hypothetical protein
MTPLEELDTIVVVRVKDGSFNNRAPVGAYAIMESSARTPVPGRAYVILHDDDVMIRRYLAAPPRWVPDSLDCYPSFGPDQIEVLGRVHHFHVPAEQPADPPPT